MSLTVSEVTRSAGFQIITIRYKTSVYLMFGSTSQQLDQNTKGKKEKRNSSINSMNLAPFLIFLSICLNYSLYKIRYTYIHTSSSGLNLLKNGYRQIFEHRIFTVRKVISSSLAVKLFFCVLLRFNI
jgi:hypothetical protein